MASPISSVKIESNEKGGDNDGITNIKRKDRK